MSVDTAESVLDTNRSANSFVAPDVAKNTKAKCIHTVFNGGISMSHFTVQALNASHYINTTSKKIYKKIKLVGIVGAHKTNVKLEVFYLVLNIPNFA